MSSYNENELRKSSPHSAPPPPPATVHGQPPATGIPVTPPNYGGDDNKPQAPAPDQMQRDINQGIWSTGLCDCCDDVPNCCITYWCPCITFGQIAEIVDKGTFPCAASGLLYFLVAFVFGCPCLYSCFYRTKLRNQYQLAPENGPCEDFLVHCCCESCALCQEYRELKNRGFDMSIGWQGNVDKKSRGVTMAPVVHGEMSR